MRKKDAESEALTEMIYRNVHAYTEHNGMKISEVEKMVGVSTGFISRTKTLKNLPSLVTVIRLAKVMGVKVDDLLTNEYSLNLRIADLEREKLRIEQELNQLRQ